MPMYDEAAEPPERLFIGIRHRHLVVAKVEGLRALNRSYVPLWEDPLVAEQIARRRGGEPVVVEVRAREAHAAGTRFLKAGESFYLTKSVAARYLVFPRISFEEEELKPVVPASRKRTVGAAKDRPETIAGSFFIEPQHLEKAFPGGNAEFDAAKKSSQKKEKKQDNWKRAARKERRKREV